MEICGCVVEVESNGGWFSWAEYRVNNSCLDNDVGVNKWGSFDGKDRRKVWLKPFY